MYQNIAFLAAFAFVYSAVAGRLASTPVNGAIVFGAFGLAFGPIGLGLIEPDVEAEDLRLLAEATLSLVLFTDAAHADLGVLKKSFRIPRRLLLIGLPLTILLGFGFGVLIFDGLTFLEIAVLATMLAPTDAALGRAVVTDESVPAQIRQSLNMESGLNDGICVPILFVFLALATTTGGEADTLTLALTLVAEEVGIGAGVGIGLTFLGAWLLRHCGDRGWVTDIWRQLPVAALAVACFTTAQALGGSGFIACYVGGLLFCSLAKSYKHKLLLAAEGTGDTLSLITWVVFGAAVVGREIENLSWEVVLYSLLSLTLIRILPVYLALLGLDLRNDAKLFIGWFGPRGLASVVFAVIVLNEHLPGGGTVVATAACTIILSVVLHGLSANPLIAALFARKGRSEATDAADKSR